MKLKLFSCDMEEGTISFRVPVEIFKKMHFHPMECEVDISDMLHEEEILLPTPNKTLTANNRGV